MSNVGHITERLAERISAVRTALAGPAVAGAGSAAASCQYFAILYGACRISGVSGKNLRKGCHVTWASSYRTGGAAKKPRKMSEIDDCARYFDHFSFVAQQPRSSTCGFVNRESLECAQVVHNRQSRSFLARKWQRPTLCRYDERGRYQAAADKGGACQAMFCMPDSLRPRPSMGRPTLLLIFLVSALLSADSRSSCHKTRQLYDPNKLSRPLVFSAVDLPGLLSCGEDHDIRNSHRHRTIGAFCATNSEKPRTLRRPIVTRSAAARRRTWPHLLCRSSNISTRGGCRATWTQSAEMFASECRMRQQIRPHDTRPQSTSKLAKKGD